MTDNQRNEIQRLRQSGMGYVKIAQMLDLSANTVKSFCQRNPLVKNALTSAPDTCPQCGARLPANSGRKSRRFCSSECRTRYWSKHQAQIVRKTAVASVCAACGKTFTDYAGKGRKYCSHACYIKARFGGKAHGRNADARAV